MYLLYGQHPRSPGGGSLPQKPIPRVKSLDLHYFCFSLIFLLFGFIQFFGIQILKFWHLFLVLFFRLIFSISQLIWL
jgi:hypothetical protein